MIMNKILKKSGVEGGRWKVEGGRWRVWRVNPNFF